MSALAGCASPPTPPTTTSPEQPSPSSINAGLTRQEAIDRARAAAEPLWASGEVLQVESGRFADLGNLEVKPMSLPAPLPDTQVWRVNLGNDPGPLMGQGQVVILDFFDGRVIQTYTWIS